MAKIAGSLQLEDTMARLASVRPVFHSEADFQHAFGQVVHDLDPELHVRLEVRQEASEHLDMVCFGPGGSTAIEFKYFTTTWEGTDPKNGEHFHLKSHAAADLARRNFVFDIERLERFRGEPELPANGLAIMLTNYAGLWEEPRRKPATRDAEFRIHEGRTLIGTLEWAGGTYLPNRRELRGDYLLSWHDYSRLNGSNGAFRWLAVEVVGFQRLKTRPSDGRQAGTPTAQMSVEPGHGLSELGGRPV